MRPSEAVSIPRLNRDESTDRRGSEPSRMRRHKYQHDQALRAWVFHSVFLARARMGGHAGRQFPPLGADLHEASTFEHIVDLIGSVMLMGRLLLFRFKAVHVTEHPLRFE